MSPPNGNPPYNGKSIKVTFVYKASLSYNSIEISVKERLYLFLYSIFIFKIFYRNYVKTYSRNNNVIKIWSTRIPYFVPKIVEIIRKNIDWLYIIFKVKVTIDVRRLMYRMKRYLERRVVLNSIRGVCFFVGGG